MKAYISVSYSKRKHLEKELAVIRKTLNAAGITAFVFVDAYAFGPNEEQQMMQRALLDIDACDLLIAETSEKAIGIGVEAGYAKAKGKPVIYLRHIASEHSTTVSGISDFHIIYSTVEDLAEQLAETLVKVKHAVAVS